MEVYYIKLYPVVIMIQPFKKSIIHEWYYLYLLFFKHKIKKIVAFMNIWV